MVYYWSLDVCPGPGFGCWFMSLIRRSTVLSVLVAILLLVSDPAFALRCGNKLIRDGMDETRVIDLCGEPVSRRHLGYVLRPYILKRPVGAPGYHSTRHVYGGYHEELLVTELTFNFGPHKLMRIIRFEGGRVTSIKTAGYGYREKSR